MMLGLLGPQHETRLLDVRLRGEHAHDGGPVGGDLDRRVLWDRGREHEAGVVVGVLADQIDPPGGATRCLRRAAEDELEEAHAMRLPSRAPAGVSRPRATAGSERPRAAERLKGRDPRSRRQSPGARCPSVISPVNPIAAARRRCRSMVRSAPPTPRDSHGSARFADSLTTSRSFYTSLRVPRCERAAFEVPSPKRRCLRSVTRRFRSMLSPLSRGPDFGNAPMALLVLCTQS
jgi:hypothetical protein